MRQVIKVHVSELTRTTSENNRLARQEVDKSTK